MMKDFYIMNDFRSLALLSSVVTYLNDFQAHKRTRRQPFWKHKLLNNVCRFKEPEEYLLLQIIWIYLIVLELSGKHIKLHVCRDSYRDTLT